MPDVGEALTQVLENKFVRLEILVHAGRVLRLSPAGKANLFAETTFAPVQTPYGEFLYRGGHRLWHSPESMPRTYIPDNDGAVLRAIDGGLLSEQPPEPWTQIGKRIEIRLDPGQPRVELRHELRNAGAWTVELAPWAVTMFRLGGVGIFPQPRAHDDGAGLLPNRHLALWPYASIRDPRLTLHDDFIFVRAEPQLPPLKFGYLNHEGWVAYLLDGVTFIKRFEPGEQGRIFPDGGCNIESYCNDQFFELETLGPLGRLEPGASVSHTETWELHDGIDQPPIPAEAGKLIGAI